MSAITDALGANTMFKLTILGDGGVGKTALVIQLCLNKFLETYDPTIEDSYRKRILLDGRPTTLEVMDTAGQEEFFSLHDQWIRDGEGFILVYSITQRVTFARVKEYYNQIQQIKEGEPFGAVLVGNKLDQGNERQVSTQEGEQLARSWGVPFYETSAKMNINAENAFLTVARLTRDTRDDPHQELSHQQQRPQNVPPGMVPGYAPSTTGGVGGPSAVGGARASIDSKLRTPSSGPVPNNDPVTQHNRSLSQQEASMTSQANQRPPNHQPLGSTSPDHHRQRVVSQRPPQAGGPPSAHQRSSASSAAGASSTGTVPGRPVNGSKTSSEGSSSLQSRANQGEMKKKKKSKCVIM